MAILICKTRRDKCDIIDTAKVSKISIIHFEESGRYKVCIYPNEFEVFPIDVILRDQDNIEALLKVLQADGYFIIENGEIHVWQGQGLFKRGGE